MTTALLTPPPARVRPTSNRLFTVADLAAMPDALPSGPVRYELDDGVLIAMAPAADIHSAKQFVAGVILYLHAQAKGLGEGRTESAIILRRNPDRVAIADAAFLTTDQFPLKHSKEGYLETIPKLTVEVKSKNDSWPEVESKVAEYLAAGVELVWVLDQKASAIRAYAANQPTQVFAAADTLTAPFLPGFAVPVADFFA